MLVTYSLSLSLPLSLSHVGTYYHRRHNMNVKNCITAWCLFIKNCYHLVYFVFSPFPLTFFYLVFPRYVAPSCAVFSFYPVHLLSLNVKGYIKFLYAPYPITMSLNVYNETYEVKSICPSLLLQKIFLLLRPWKRSSYTCKMRCLS